MAVSNQIQGVHQNGGARSTAAGLIAILFLRTLKMRYHPVESALGSTLASWLCSPTMSSPKQLYV